MYTYPFFLVYEDRVIRPDGRKGKYSFLSLHPTVGVLALTNDQHVPLIREYRYPLRGWTLGIPRGLSDRGETALQAARREAREEAGVVNGQWRSLGHIYPSSGITDETVRLFLAHEAELVPPRPESQERQTVVVVSFERALRWAARGIITDAPTVVALFRASAYVRQHRKRGKRS